MRTKIRRHFSFIGVFSVLVTLILAGCRGAPAPTSPHGVPTVYAAGSAIDGGMAFPCFWEAGKEIDLPVFDLVNARTNAIFVSPWGAIYTGGSYFNRKKSVPCRWLGTERTDLSYGAGGTVLSLFVSPQGWAYAAGFSLAGGEVRQVPCYWAGSAQFDLPGGEAGAALSIFVFEGTVYTAGYYKSNSRFVPCYWRGTARTDLPCGAGGGEATSILVSEDSVFVAGSDGGVPCFWKGDTETMLPGRGQATSIFVSGETVYTAGQSDGQACDWANATRTALAVDGSESAVAYSVLVRDGTVYTAGVYSKGGRDVLCLWTDSARTDLTDPTQDLKIGSVFLR
jgi:hypothetical protein